MNSHRFTVFLLCLPIISTVAGSIVSDWFQLTYLQKRFTEKPRLNSFPVEVTQNENSFYVFTCSLSSGTMPVTFAWHFNGNPLKPDDGPSIETNDQFSFLKLSPVKRHHSGKYSCVASNQDGFDSTQTVLTVQGCRLCCMPKCGAKVWISSHLYTQKTQRY